MLDNAPLLLVEDDAVDLLLIHRVFRTLGISNPVLEAPDGEAALQLLQKEGTPRPGLILLDLNMPRMNGLEFLKQMKADPELHSIPVVILTTSNERRDVESCYQQQCAGYLVKPVDFTEFTSTIEALQTYWTYCEAPANQHE